MAKENIDKETREYVMLLWDRGIDSVTAAKFIREKGITKKQFIRLFPEVKNEST